MSIASRLNPLHRLPKSAQGICLALAPAVIAALAIAACTGHSDSKSDSASNVSANDETKDRTPASGEGAKTTDESIASFVDATGTGKGKGKTKHGGKAAHAHAAKSVDNVYVVQIGAFRVKENAEKLNQKLKSEGYPVVMQELEHSSNGQLYLVRLNPMADRHEAETMRLNLKSKVDIDSMVLALPKNEREVSSVHATADGTSEHEHTEVH